MKSTLVRLIRWRTENGDSWLSLALFYIPFAVWMISFIALTTTSFAGWLEGVVSIHEISAVCIVTLAIREVLFGKWNKYALLGLAVFCAMAFSLSLNTDAYRVLYGLPFIFAARNLPLKQVLCVCFTLMVFMIVATTLCSQIGILPSHVMEDGARVRHYLGFGHPNTGPTYVFSAVCLYAFIRSKRLQMFEVVLLLGITAAVYLLTGSRTALIATLFVVLICSVRPNEQSSFKSRQTHGVLLALLIPFIAAISVGVCAIYDPSSSTLEELNAALSGRVALGHWALEEYGVSILGQHVQFTPMSTYSIQTGEWLIRENPHPVDCLYVSAAVQYGLLFLILALLLASLTTYIFVLRSDWSVGAIFVCIAIYAVSEATIAFLYFTPLLIIIGMVFSFSTAEWKAICNGET